MKKKIGHGKLPKGQVIPLNGKTKKQHDTNQAIGLMIVEEKLKAQRDLLVKIEAMYSKEKSDKTYSALELKSFFLKALNEKEIELERFSKNKNQPMQ